MTKSTYYSVPYSTYELALSALDNACGYVRDNEGNIVTSNGYFADIFPFGIALLTGEFDGNGDPIFGDTYWYFNIYNTMLEYDLDPEPWMASVDPVTPYRVVAM